MPPKQTVSQKLEDLQENMIKVLQLLGIMGGDITGLKQDVSGLKQDVSGLRHDMSEVKDDLGKLDHKVDLLTDKFLTNEVKTVKRLKVLEMKQGIYHD